MRIAKYLSLFATSLALVLIVSCDKISKIEKHVNGGSFIVTLDPSDSGDFVCSDTITNNFKKEIEKAGINPKLIKSVRGVIDSIMIINTSQPDLTFDQFTKIKLDVVGMGFDRRVLSSIEKFEQGGTKYIPKESVEVSWKEITNSEGDLIFTLSGHKKLKTPLKKDMKYCVSFYVSLSGDSK